MSNTTSEVRNSSDWQGLEAVLQGLIGQRCWKAKFTYGDELALHLGEVRVTRHNLKEGSWIFGSRATTWRLLAPGKAAVTSDETREALLPHLAQLEGAKVVVATVPCCGQDLWPGLLLVFDNGVSLQLLPSLEDMQETVDLWELFTPDNMVLKFSPRVVWSLRRGDVPLEAEEPEVASVT